MYAWFMGLPSVSPQQARDLLERGAAIALDLNSEQSWRSARVPGARHLARADFTRDDLPPPGEQILIFYCSNYLCRKAPNAARRARGLGHERIAVMSAGIAGWQSAGMPTQSGV
jgi:rhodanese-related sulfurtransferase